MNAAARPIDSAPLSHNLRETRDADEHAACLTNWQQRYDQLSAGPFAGEFEEFCFGNVQVFREALNQTVHQAGLAWPGSLTFAAPVAIQGTGWFNGTAFATPSMMMFGSDDMFDFRTPRQLEILAFTVDAGALDAYALQVDHCDLEAEIGSRNMAPAPPGQMESFTALLRTIMASLRATPDLLCHPQMRKAMEQALFAGVLDTLSSSVTVRSPAPSCRTRQLVVARARDYMQAHIEEPITVADLCLELGVSRRTLQYSFQDVLDLNPVKFLRAIRLNAVRRTLKTADPSGGTTVADVAARWGFWHLSHFAAEYKTMFGELPSETLRRAG